MQLREAASLVDEKAERQVKKLLEAKNERMMLALTEKWRFDLAADVQKSVLFALVAKMFSEKRLPGAPPTQSTPVQPAPAPKPPDDVKPATEPALPPPGQAEPAVSGLSAWLLSTIVCLGALLVAATSLWIYKKRQRPLST